MLLAGKAPSPALSYSASFAAALKKVENTWCVCGM
jgi:hypothetical protein